MTVTKSINDKLEEMRSFLFFVCALLNHERFPGRSAELLSDSERSTLNEDVLRHFSSASLRLRLEDGICSAPALGMYDFSYAAGLSEGRENRL